MVKVIAAGPGPTRFASGGAASASLTNKPVPNAPPPMPTPLKKPRREKPLGLAGSLGSFLELTRNLPLVRRGNSANTFQQSNRVNYRSEEHTSELSHRGISSA